MITVTVKGESEFGLPKEYTEITIEEPTIAAVLEHFGVSPRIRKHLFPVINNRMGTSTQELADGDRVLLQSP